MGQSMSSTRISFSVFQSSTVFPPGVFFSTDVEQLSISDFSWQHVGIYTCIARNIEGASSSTGKLSIQVPPLIEDIKGESVINTGEHLELTCITQGEPVPSVHWSSRGEIIKESQDGQITLPDTASLLIKFVSPNMAGPYTCTSVNIAGTATRSIEIFIIDKPLPPELSNPTPVSPTSVNVSWVPVEQPVHTPVTGYYIYYRQRIELVLHQYPAQIGGSLTNMEVEGLQPATDYIFSVSAYNDVGEGVMSNVKNVRTLDSGPSKPRNFKVLLVNATSIHLEWEVPAYPNGVIMKYQIQYRLSDSTAAYDSILVASHYVALETHNVIDLDPFTSYIFRMRAATVQHGKTLWGDFTDTIQARTNVGVPTGVAQNVRVTVVSSDTIHVSWEPVPVDQQNGLIRRYDIKYHHVNIPDSMGVIVVTSLDLEANITNLLPWRWYAVIVEARNDAGTGPASFPVEVRTLPAVPSGPPRHVEISAQSSQEVLVKWAAPDPDLWNSDLGGYVVSYMVVGGDANFTSVKNNTNSHIIRNLKPWTEYRIKVAAFTTQITDGLGPFSIPLSVHTMESASSPVVDLTFTVTPSSVTLNWMPPQTPNGVIQYYDVVYHIILPERELPVSPIDEEQEISENDAGLSRSERSLTVSDQKSSEWQYFENDELDFIVLTNVTFWLQNEDYGMLKNICLLATQYNKSLEELKSEALIDRESVMVVRISAWMLEYKLTLPSVCDVLGQPILVVTIRTQSRTLVLEDLAPGSEYNVTVVPYTGAGPGNPFFILIQTDDLPEPSPLPVTTSVPETTANYINATELGVAGADNPQNLPVIVAGALTGGFLVIFIIILIICRCQRRKRRDHSRIMNGQAYSETFDSGVHYDPDSCLVTIHGPGHLWYIMSKICRTIQKHQVPINSHEAYSRHPPNITVQDGTVVYRTTPRRPPVSMIPDSNSDSDRGSMASPNSSPFKRPSFPKHKSYSGYPGVENPAYRDDNASLHSVGRESVSVSMTLSAEEVYSQPEATLRKNKMRSESAAAIAVLRNSDLPAEYSFNDTESLINDSVVVYNERTAL
ncbi:hypothetical protein ScPMuIL_010453 [Solemya velum]